MVIYIKKSFAISVSEWSHLCQPEWIQLCCEPQQRSRREQQQPLQQRQHNDGDHDNILHWKWKGQLGPTARLNQFERVKTSLKNCCWNHEVSLKWYNSRITRRESNLRHDKLRHIIQCSITLSYFIRCSVTSNYVIRFCVTSSCVGPFNVASRNSFFMTSSNVSSCHIVVQHCVAPRLTLCYIASRQFASRGVAFEN